MPNYIGRFAPSPTGPLHAGSLVAALASWLDARAAGGRWLVRIEDADRPRCPPGMGGQVLQQLAACGLVPDDPPWWQSARDFVYAAALRRLIEQGLAYPCGCTRREIEGALASSRQPPQRDGERVYPGTCRAGLQGKPPRAWRLDVMAAWGAKASEIASVGASTGASTDAGTSPSIGTHEPGPCLAWTDRRLGAQQQHLATAVGDFVLHRADGLWAYQLAVVVDDAAQGITHVVRGEDLADNTARQCLLQRALGLPTPRYLHMPLVLAADGHKLSKQNGAVALDLSHPQRAVAAALQALDVPVPNQASLADTLAGAVPVWRARWPA